MYKNILKNAGLTDVQTEIYDFLLNNGEFKASIIAKRINRPRGVIYKGLEELILLELVEKHDDINMVSVFKVGHPSKIENLYESKEKSLKQNKKQYYDQLSDLTSTYNLTFNKPGIKFYEGRDGLKKVVYDTLKSKTTIYTFADKRTIQKGFKGFNEDYKKRRKRAGIKKLVIVPLSDKEYYNENQVDKYTEHRFLPGNFPLFKTGMQIYDNKISYQTFDQDNIIAVLIEDKQIYEMHKIFFEYVWQKLNNNPPDNSISNNKSFSPSTPILT